MRIITIDYGNTFSKIALFENSELLQFWNSVPSNELVDILCQQKIDEGIICSVSKPENEIAESLKAVSWPYTFFTSQNPIPIGNNYLSIETLGTDRLAAAVGAWQLFPAQNCLIIDIGTCIKYDLMSEDGNFEGGIIGPGLKMRFKAMHHFTKKLPLINETEPWPNLIGKTTTTAMQSGVLNGMLAEVEGIIDQYTCTLTKFKIILTGGDAQKFESRLKNTTFVVPELVNIGLNAILMYQLKK